MTEKTLVLEEGREKRGVKLKKVWRKEVLLEVGGEEIRLRVSPPETSAEEQAPAGSSSEVRISRREVERITKDPGIMFREIRLVPYVKNGKTEGFIFEWIKPGSLFYRAGLRKGDILVSINNMTIRSGEDAFRILQALRNEPSLKVVVLRQGQRREIDIRIE
ncbi:MAG: type II secretion system protein GspC [Aquificota bacterium]|nr:type II secretion system protein GspC [Aquificota bacterium]